MASSSANAAQSAGYSVAPEIAAAQNAPGSGQTGRSWQATPADGPAKPAAPEDPLLRWFHETFHEASAWWIKKNFKPWQKLLILVGADCTVCFSRSRPPGAVAESGRRGTTFGEFLLIVGVCYWLYRNHQAKKAKRENVFKTAFDRGAPPMRIRVPIKTARPAHKRVPQMQQPFACGGKSDPTPLAKDFQHAAVSTGAAA